MMPPWCHSDVAAGPLAGQLPRHFFGDGRGASPRFEVMNTARASASCSAWAMRSAAIHDARPRVGHDQDLGRPGVEVDRAIRRDQRLGGRHPAVAGSDDLADARHRRRAVGHRRHRVGAAEPEDAVDAGLDGRGQHDRIHRRDCRRSLRARRRRGPGSPSSAATTAADTVRRARSSRRDRAGSRAATTVTPGVGVTRHSRGRWASATTRIARAACLQRRPHRARRLPRAGLDLPPRHLDRPAPAVERAGIAPQRRIALGPHPRDDARRRPLGRPITDDRRREQRLDFGSVGRN